MAQEKIIVRGDADLRDLIPVFLANRRDDVGRLRQALEQADDQTVKTLAHRMKGEGGGYGFDGISTIGAAMETAIKGDDRARVRSLVDDLADYLDRVEVVFD